MVPAEDEQVSANEQQVGGSHYKNDSKYEHWDWVLDTGVGYLEGYATKYVCRWRQKDGSEGLRKALHVVNKLEENWARATSIANRARYVAVVDATERLTHALKLSPTERSFMEYMATWRTVEDLAEAREVLFQLLDETERVPADPAPVPLCEENHHADRVGGVSSEDQS